MSVRRKIRALLTLRRREWGLLTESMRSLTLAKVRLRLRRHESLIAALAPRSGERGEVDVSLLRMFAVAAANHPLRPTCLPRALALQEMLRRRGIEAKLCIGVTKREGQLQGHAWIEVGGVPVNDRFDIASEFTPLQLTTDIAEAWADKVR